MYEFENVLLPALPTYYATHLATLKKVFLYTIICLHLIAINGPAALSQDTQFRTDEFLYGVSVYPELLTREEQTAMLDLFQKAGFNMLRVGESSWGNLEPSPGKFNFGWLRYFLDEMHKRNMKAMLGTGSYIAPQWLAAKHPEMLWQYEDGSHAHSMGRHSASRNHPLFRAELKNFILALGKAFKDHPAIIGWQLDNEIEWNIAQRIDYNPANEKAWSGWLQSVYHNSEELNRRLGLNAWGLQTGAIEDVRQPSRTNEGDLPILRLANMRFQGDNVMEYFRWQKSLLRSAGVDQWITTDWVMVPQTITDLPWTLNPLDISGVNQYQPAEDNPAWWARQASFNNLHRSYKALGRFLVMETRIGPSGAQKIWTASPSHDQFITWMIQPAAFGANGLMHWTGNRFNGGHWPHWGGMLDWSGRPEPDFLWATELAAFYKKWGKVLVSTTVDATAAVYTDFDQRVAIMNYPHVPSEGANELWTEAMEAFHKNGIGVDAVNAGTIKNYEQIKKYKILVIAASPAFDGSACKPALRQFVENGGTLIITPLTGYQTWDGIFRNEGFAADLTDLSGVLVRTVRLLGSSQAANDTLKNKVEWDGPWRMEPSLLGLDGLTEILETQAGARVIARFATSEEVMNGRAAVTMNTVGKGSVVKFAFWPADNTFTKLVHAVTAHSNPYLQGYLPAGVQAVPRTDKSFFIINNLSSPANVSLQRPMTDRISGTARGMRFSIKPYELIWLQ